MNEKTAHSNLGVLYVNVLEEVGDLIQRVETLKTDIKSSEDRLNAQIRELANNAVDTALNAKLATLQKQVDVLTKTAAGATKSLAEAREDWQAAMGLYGEHAKEPAAVEAVSFAGYAIIGFLALAVGIFIGYVIK